ncbi:LamG-like jellyroll fold domain-containing protein [Yinghuangia sp. YIM S09857]|uniref:LamG-like jellyroll fold domain-containing protein n=1 Tax=Yinghuangia sp. YIM S09857 TaxID=3436929 RepID=UPI003F52CC91
MATGAKPAGWYEDPHGYTGTARWWDGSAWTEETRPIGEAGTEAGIEAGPEAVEPVEAGDEDTTSPDAPSTPAPPNPVPAADRGPTPAAVPGSVWPAAALAASVPPEPPPQRVVFEVLDPNRRRKRIGAAVGFGTVAVMATVFGILFGASDDDGKSPAADASRPTASAPASGPAPGGGQPAPEATPPPGATPAPPVPVPADAIAHWELNQGAADTRERFHGTTAGIVTWSPEQSGSAFFAGDGSIQTRTPAVDTTRSFTIAAWAKVTETKAHQTIVAQDGTQVSGFYLHYNKDAGTWAFVRTSEDSANPAQWYTASSAQPAKVGAWTSLAAVYDAPTGQMTLYVDGVAQGSAVAAQSWKAAGPLTIGRATSGVDQLNGSVADVQAFDRVLSPAEVAALAGTQR